MSDSMEVRLQVHIASEDQVIEVSPFEAGVAVGMNALIVRATGPGVRGEPGMIDIAVANPRVTDMATLIEAIEELAKALRGIEQDEQEETD